MSPLLLNIAQLAKLNSKIRSVLVLIPNSSHKDNTISGNIQKKSPFGIFSMPIPVKHFLISLWQLHIKVCKPVTSNHWQPISTLPRIGTAIQTIRFSHGGAMHRSTGQVLLLCPAILQTWNTQLWKLENKNKTFKLVQEEVWVLPNNLLPTLLTTPPSQLPVSSVFFYRKVSICGWQDVNKVSYSPTPQTVSAAHRSGASDKEGAKSEGEACVCLFFLVLFFVGWGGRNWSLNAGVFRLSLSSHAPVHKFRGTETVTANWKWSHFHFRQRTPEKTSAKCCRRKNTHLLTT